MENIIFKRRSIRRFDDGEVSQEVIERVLRAGMQAPSAHNQQPWKLIVVKDKSKLYEISQMSPYAKMTQYAFGAIIVALDKKSLTKTDEYWQQDLGACTQNILLQLVEESLGGVWLGFYPAMERVNTLREFLSLDEDIVPFSVVAFGHSPKENEFVDRYDPEKVIFID